MRIVEVKARDSDLIKQSAELMSTMYGRGSPYAQWIVNGFRPYGSEYVLGQVNNPERSLHVVIENGRVFGTIILQRTAGHMVFHKFCVSNEHRGSGMGKRLMRFAERRARAEGFTRMRIEVFSAAFRLFNYYVKNGYSAVIDAKPLQEDEHTRYTCRGASYGFITLEKTL